MLKNGKVMEEMLVAVVYLLMEERNCWLSQHPLRSLFRRPSCAPIVASVVTPTTEKCCFLYIVRRSAPRETDLSGPEEPDGGPSDVVTCH